MHEEEEAVWAEAETGLRSHKPRNARSHQKLKEARDRISPRAAGGSTALPTT